MNKQLIETRSAERKRCDTQGFVYFVECLPLEAVKIGFTRGSPRERLKGLQCGSPAPLRLNCYFPGSLEDERRLHQSFAFLRIHGEWFRASGKLSDMLYFLTSGSPDGRNVGEDRFEHAVLYALYEGRPDEPPEVRQIYDQTGDWRPFADLIGVDR